MKKYAYLARLEELLEALPAEERQDALNYYEEFFDASGAEDSAAAGWRCIGPSGTLTPIRSIVC